MEKRKAYFFHVISLQSYAGNLFFSGIFKEIFTFPSIFSFLCVLWIWFFSWRKQQSLKSVCNTSNMFIGWFHASLRHKKGGNFFKKVSKGESRIIPRAHLFRNFKGNFHISFNIFISMCPMTVFFSDGNSKGWRVFLELFYFQAKRL